MSNTQMALIANISIHALREEGDEVHEAMDKYIDEFLSTPSARRATDDVRDAFELGQISIHALREEGDAQTAQACCRWAEFLSTPSARRATLMAHARRRRSG